MKILLVSGHTSGYNPSQATGVNEGDLNIELVKLLRPRLEKYAEVTVYPYERDLYQDNRHGKPQVNLAAFDYIFEVHFNGFDGKANGTGIYLDELYGGGTSVEQAVLKKIVALGFKNRGITRRGDLMNMRIALSKGVDYALLETCFFDNVADMNRYKANKNKVADAITEGIAEAFGLKKVETYTPWPAKIIDAKELNVRETPNGKVVKTLQAITVIGEEPDSDGDTWYKVQLGDGTVGYIWPKYLSK